MLKSFVILLLISLAVAKSPSRNSWCSRETLREAFEAALTKRVVTTSSGGSRIVNGQPASRGQFGFFTSLESFDGRWQTPCGGALIRYNWVLTAGQCVICARSVTAIFGQVDRMGGPISWLTHITNPDHIKIHDKYNPWNFEANPFVNDIALIFLEQATDPILLPFVNTIRIATDPSVNFYGAQSAAMGFGSTEDPPGALSLTLNYVEMLVTTNEICNASFPGIIVESNLCTDTRQGGSTCQGDAGGPLIYFDNDTTEFVLIGVGSFRHREGCTLGHPAVFTRVTSHLNWIHNILDEAFPQVPAPPEPPTDDGCHCHCHINA